MTSTAIVAYLALFATIGFLFVLVSLLLGRVLRASAPTAEKVECYECGEPAVGPGTVQFDLRFYVVALLFLIFEVEVALFFPPATVFGKASHLLANKPRQCQVAVGQVDNLPCEAATDALTLGSAQTLALTSMLDLGVFFAVLLVGFAYVWRRGDLDWVRAVRHPPTEVENATTLMRLRGDSQP